MGLAAAREHARRAARRARWARAACSARASAARGAAPLAVARLPPPLPVGHRQAPLGGPDVARSNGVLLPLRDPAAPDPGGLVRAPAPALGHAVLYASGARDRVRGAVPRVRAAASAAPRFRAPLGVPGADRPHGQLRLLQPADLRAQAPAPRRRAAAPGPPALPAAAERASWPVAPPRDRRRCRRALRCVPRGASRRIREAQTGPPGAPPRRAAPDRACRQSLRPLQRDDAAPSRDRDRGLAKRRRFSRVRVSIQAGRSAASAAARGAAPATPRLANVVRGARSSPDLVQEPHGSAPRGVPRGARLVPERSVRR